MGKIQIRGKADGDYLLSRPILSWNKNFKTVIHNRSIYADYSLQHRILGSAVSTPVFSAIHKLTSRKYAIKRYRKKVADLQRAEFLKSEAKVYLMLDHPNVARLISIYEDDRYVWMIMEFCSGKDLYTNLIDKLVYSEHDAAAATYQMLQAIYYLHSHNIVHRDLKLENWLYENSGETARLKLIDFGLSKFWSPWSSQKMMTSCGSISYVSPDILKGAYTNACDMWSLGVIVYMLLVGVPPFIGRSDEDVLANVKNGFFSLSGSKWKDISENAKHFVGRLLQVDPAKRITAKVALQHPWLKEMVRPQKISLNKEVLTCMRRFSSATGLKRAALVVIASFLNSSETSELTELFLSFDEDGDGRINMSEFAKKMKEAFDICNSEIFNLFYCIRATDECSRDETVKEWINYTDFIAASLKSQLHFGEDAIMEAFCRFDIERNGYITVDDLMRVLGNTFQGAKIFSLLALVDQDNGKIDYTRFLNMIIQEEEISMQKASKEHPFSSLSNCYEDTVNSNNFEHERLYKNNSSGISSDTLMKVFS